MGKSGKGLKVFAVILMIIAIASIAVGVLIQYKVISFGNNTDVVEESDDDSDIILEEELDVNDSKVQELLTLIKGKDNLSRHKYLPQYMDSFYYKLTGEKLVNEINNDDLLKILWFNLKDSKTKTDIEGGFTVSVDEFQKMYESIFGDSLTFSKDTTSTSADACLKVNYNTANDNYEFYDTCTNSSSIEIIPRVERATKTDNEIRIYEKVAFFDNNALYSDIDLRTEVTKEYKDDDFDKYSTSLSTYVYTFRLADNGNYYFYKISVE